MRSIRFIMVGVVHRYFGRHGLNLNPYDPCVANSQVKGKQCTVAWYVDDNKISHVDATVVTDVIEKLKPSLEK